MRLISLQIHMLYQLNKKKLGEIQMTEELIKLPAMPTPNPNTVKFLVNKTFMEVGSIDLIQKKSKWL